MEQENGSAGRAVKEPSISVGTRENDQDPPIVERQILDFHSPEFNRIDELNDWSGNYRVFQDLEGVTTADMRHQMERRKRKDFLGRPGKEKEDFEKGSLAGAESQVSNEARPLTVISRGRTLIIDTEAERAMACGQRLNDQGLTCTLVVTQAPPSQLISSRSGRPAILKADSVSISGAFGGFSAITTITGVNKNPAEGNEGQTEVFDLVLDLLPIPAYAGDLLPLGYYAPGPDAADLDAALTEMPELRGRFKKPRFIQLQEDRCILSRSKKKNCRSCVEICPFEAIRAREGKIAIDHHLCQGCGGCALVCPVEAIRLNDPSQEMLQNQLRQSLAFRTGTGDFPKTLVISDKERTDEHPLPDSEDRTVYFAVDHITQVGPEILLAALAYGAGEVLIALGSQNTPRINKALEAQMQMARTILQGLGLSEDRVRLAADSSESPGPDKNISRSSELEHPAAFYPGPDKRRNLRLAAQHLYDQCGTGRPEIPLPPGSSFGAINVDHGACTLCLACVSSCPSRALSSGGQEPQLKFQESLCYQCGICQETCPEGAIQLFPRLLCDLEAVETPVILLQAEPFRCIECGLAFTTPAMIQRMQKKLRGHWMYAEERQLRRLRMCGTCRARDALKSEDMRLWNQK